MSQLKRFNGIEFEPVQSSSLLTVLKNVSNNNDLLYAGTSVYVNTSGGAFTLSLPASPSVGDHVQINDSNNTFGTNNLTIDNNSQNINGTSATLICDVSGVIINFYYVGSSLGWKVQIEGDIATVSSPAIISLDGLTSDYELQIGETAVLNYSNATSVPLHVKTVEGEYKLSIQGDKTLTASTNGSGALLLPNNTTSSTFQTYQPYIKSDSNYGMVAFNSESGFRIGQDIIEFSESIISTKTKGKGIFSKALTKNSTSVGVSMTPSGSWSDTTTPWTSLGTITFPSAQSGKITIRRII